jgi:hypothetical protein
VEECEGCFYLWFNLTSVYAVCKNSFTKGNAEEFMAFMGEKGKTQASYWSKAQLKRKLFMPNLPLVIVLACFLIIDFVRGLTALFAVLELL